MASKNEMWRRVEALIAGGQIEYDPDRGRINVKGGHRSDWKAVQVRCSRYIAHPATVAAVQRMAGSCIVTAVTGTTFWPYLLAEGGADVICYEPPTIFGGEKWLAVNGHRVHRLDAACTVIRQHKDRTLLLLPDSRGAQNKAAGVLREYLGKRVVYMGDFPPKSDKLRRQMAGWVPTSMFRPVQWEAEPFEIYQLERPTGRGKVQMRVEETSWDQPTHLFSALPSDLVTCSP